MTNRKRALLAFSLSIAVAACDAVPTRSDEIGTDVQPLYLDGGITLWTANDNLVPVCWTTAALATERGWVREAVERTWQKNAALRFTGWGACPTSGTERFVKMEMIETHDTTRFGIVTPAKDNGLTDHPWGVEALALPSQGPTVHFWVPDKLPRNRGRIEYLAVHEIGHLLGFLHEHARPDNPDDRDADPAYCNTKGETSTGGTYESGYDRDSIMHYCNKGGNHTGYLSPTDISGVQLVYGRPSRSVRAFDGRCLDVKYNLDVDGTPVWTWACGTQFTGTEAQVWSYSPVTRMMRRPGSVRALDVKNGVSAPGTPVQLYFGHGGVAQQWSFAGVEIRGIGGLCANVEPAPAGTPRRLALRPCDGSATQRFDLRSDGTLRPSDASFGGTACVEVQGARTGDGVPIQIGTCGVGQWHQTFNVTHEGRIFAYFPAGDTETTPGTGALCVDADLPDVRAFDGKGGNLLQLWRCNGRLNQQFSYSGAIKGLGGSCLAVRGDAKADGTVVDIEACSAAKGQVWEYFP